MAKEKWKRLKEEKGYLISSWGRIFSIKSEIFIRAYIHKSRSNKYLRVNLAGNKYMVHVLVAYNFKLNDYKKLKEQFPDANIQVGHDDRNTLNPNSNNLTFETERQNKEHMHATSIVSFGGKTYKGKIQEKEISHTEEAVIQTGGIVPTLSLPDGVEFVMPNPSEHLLNKHMFFVMGKIMGKCEQQLEVEWENMSAVEKGCW